MGNARYVRKREHDKRIEQGDAYNGDAYWDIKFDKLKWVAVGYDPNQAKLVEFCQLHERKGNRIVLIRWEEHYRLDALDSETGEVIESIEITAAQERTLRLPFRSA